MQVGISTACAAAAGGDPARVIDLIERSGATGVELDASLDEAQLDALTRLLGARRDGLPIWSVEAPCPRRRESTAELCAVDREESAVAVAAALATLQLAADVGADLVSLRLGEARVLVRGWPALRRCWLRGELDEDALAACVRDRAASGRVHIDPARRALDRLARAAGDLGLHVCVRNAARPIGFPTPVELRALLGDLSGAPVVAQLDLPAAHLCSQFGAVLDDTITAFTAAPADKLLVRAADACGPVAGLPPGAGELDLRRALATVDKKARLLYTPWPHLTSDEVKSAIPLLQQLTF